MFTGIRINICLIWGYSPSHAAINASGESETRQLDTLIKLNCEISIKLAKCSNTMLESSERHI